MPIDQRGREFFCGHAPRVVSLVPSLTETLFELGAGDDVAGITDFCIFPNSLGLPRLGGTKNPNVAAIRALRPELVYMNLEENLRRHADEIETFASVFATEPRTIDDVAALLVALGSIHERSERAAELVASLQGARHAASQHAPFSFACAIWKSPWMWCGGDTYVSHLVAAANGRNVLAEMSRYPPLSLEEVRALKPSVVFLPDEPWEFDAKDALEIKALFDDSKVVGPFPGHLFTWHGVRTIRGLEFLAGSIFE